MRATIKPDDYRLEVRFSDRILESGFASIPNLLIANYRDLGLSDGEAMLLIHLLRYKWTSAAPFPKLGYLPMDVSLYTRRKYVRHLRNAGLLFTRRIRHTPRTAPREDLIGSVARQAYYLDSLMVNLVAVDAWKETQKRESDGAAPKAKDLRKAASVELTAVGRGFEVRVPARDLGRIYWGWYHDVPRTWEEKAQALHDVVVATGEEHPAAHWMLSDDWIEKEDRGAKRETEDAGAFGPDAYFAN